jgi:hypothetical protein
MRFEPIHQPNGSFQHSHPRRTAVNAENEDGSMADIASLAEASYSDSEAPIHTAVCTGRPKARNAWANSTAAVPSDESDLSDSRLGQIRYLADRGRTLRCHTYGCWVE